MGLISLLWGVVALLWMILAFIPLLGWGNWFLIPFAAVGAIIAAIGILFTAPESRSRARTGLLLNGIVILVGAFRLMLGGGLF
jgi:4-amino-4-deoxy-L-arabinose transferase-like glycosyltransferase